MKRSQSTNSLQSRENLELEKQVQGLRAEVAKLERELKALQAEQSPAILSGSLPYPPRLQNPPSSESRK